MRRKKEREIGRQTDNQTDRQTKTDRHAYRPTEIYEDEVIGRDRCVERKRERPANRQTNRQTDRQRQTDMHIDLQRYMRTR